MKVKRNVPRQWATVETLPGTVHRIHFFTAEHVRTECGLKLRIRGGSGRDRVSGWMRDKDRIVTCKRCAQ